MSLENSSILTKWINFNKQYHSIWAVIILSLMSVSFIVTDWMIGIFTLSDYIFAVVGLSLIISGNYKVKKKQLLWILLILGLIAMNIIMNIQLNSSFILKTGLASLIRISYYIAITFGVYNYVKE